MSTVYDAISEVIDSIVIEAPLDWDAFNYEGMKEIAIMNSYEQIKKIINNIEFSESQKEIMLSATLAYLLMENTQLHLENLKNKK